MNASMGTILKPTTTLLTTFLLALFPALLCSGASAGSADFVLIDAAVRIPPAPIIIPKDASASIREATKALADYVRQICGTKPGIVEGSPTPLPDRAIWVGLHPELPRRMPGVKLEFDKLFCWRLGYGTSEDEGVAYALTYLFSPVAADIALHAEGGHGHHAVRGWLNGQPQPLDPGTLPMAKLNYKIDGSQPVKLQAGWNELLLRFDYIWGDLVLSLRLDGKPETLWGLRFSATPPKAANQ
jgi:hypothetical protein